MDQEVLQKLRYLLKKNKDIDYIAVNLDLERYEVFSLIHYLIENENYNLDVVNGKIIVPGIDPNPKVYEIRGSNTTRETLLILSDTHLGSKKDRLDILNYVYHKAAEKGITTVLHVGDITDGYYPNRANQIYELKAFGADEQAQYVIDNYPKIDGITTHFITGNHDFTHIRNNGTDIGKAIARDREDLVYLGPDVANITIGKLKIRLYHGAKGSSYAKSYKLQKYAELIPGNEKPHILLQGHHHTSFYMMYQDIHCLQVPALLDQTQYARQLGLVNEKGVWWLDVEMDKNKIISVTPTLETFTDKKVKVKKIDRNNK